MAIGRKGMTLGEGGTALAFCALVPLSVFIAANAYTPEYAFHACLFAAASAAAVFVIVNRYYGRSGAAAVSGSKRSTAACGQRHEAGMNVLVYLVPMALALGLTALFAFFWTIRNRQYDDMEGSALRVLSDDDVEQ
jgi:cbb3-type cytochrome oxidase maturation protein